MYDHSSLLITAALFVMLSVAIEAGYAVGLRRARTAVDAIRTHVNAIQAALLGVLALLLAFTLSLSLQRFDSRSEAVVDEANAIGTTYLRSGLLPAAVQTPVRMLLRDYVNLRVIAGQNTAVESTRQQEERARTAQLHNRMWEHALQAAAIDNSPATTGLFIQALNEMIDANSSRTAEIDRHVPELVLFLLFGTFILAAAIVGYSAGLSGQRASFATYVMVGLITLLVFIIIDLDRPRRGLIEVDQSTMGNLEAAIATDPKPLPNR